MKKILICVLTIVFCFSFCSVAFARDLTKIGDDSPSIDENVQITPVISDASVPIIPNGATVNILNESKARGNNIPTSVAAMPYYASADIAQYVYTDYCVKPSNGKMRMEFTGAVNSDTNGTCKVVFAVFNKDTGQCVAVHEVEKSSNWTNRAFNITGLNNTSKYYVKISLTDKTIIGYRDVRVTFYLALKNY